MSNLRITPLRPSLALIGFDFGRSFLAPERSLQRLTKENGPWHVVVVTVPPVSEVKARFKGIFRQDYGVDLEIQSAETIVAAAIGNRRDRP